jgi:hypothetical protein
VSISFGFGSGGASTGTFVGDYTGQHYIYGYAGAYPSGNPNINGTRIVSIDNIILNGATWNATNGMSVTYATDGNVYVYYNTSGGTGRLNFTRWFGNGGTVYSDTGDTWTGGGLQGTIFWSTLPTAPATIGTSRSGRSVTVTTTNAASDGGSNITSYGAQYGIVGQAWSGYGDVVNGSVLFTGLTPGQTYIFRTFANNAHGSGAAAVSGQVTIPNLPTAPSLSVAKSARAVTLTVGDTSSTDAPTYYVQQSLDNVTWQTAIQVTATSPRAYTYSAQTPGQTYFYRAYATSAVGQGAYSTVQSVAIATVPSAPASVTGVRAGRSVTVTVGASSSTGGDPITSYGIQYSNDSGSTWSAAVTADSNLQYTFSNLTTGTTYVFRAYATNDIGNSPTTSSAGIFISGYGKRYDQASVTGVSGDGTNMTYTAPGHGFSATDLVDVVGVTPSTLNQSQAQITAVTANTFTVAGTVTDAYTSGGTVKGFKMILNGSRWDGTQWVPVTTSQKVASGTTYSSFN